MSKNMKVYRFAEIVDGRPVDFARVIIEAEDDEFLGDLITEAREAAREGLPEGHDIYLPVTSTNMDPVVIAQGMAQITYLETSQPPRRHRR